MRIIAGKFRGRRLQTPADKSIRPTADRLREAIFSAIGHMPRKSGQPPWPQSAQVLDGFAGTGAFGLEALSRGAHSVSFVDDDPAAITLLNANCSQLAVQAQSRILRHNLAKPAAASLVHDLIFLDPPYGLDLAMPALVNLEVNGWLAPADLLVVVEIGRQDPCAVPEPFQVIRARNYGAAQALFLQRHE